MPALVASAPGRVNLIGEHTDYNGGLCLPLALPQRTTFTLVPRTDLALSLSSAQEDRVWEGVVEDRPDGWPAYVAGVVQALRDDGHEVPGFEASVDSEVPLGAGLSSSAALECSAATALAALLGLDLADRGVRRRLATACIRAENDYVGAPTGGMDQTVAMLARPGHALLLDFADGSATPVELPLDDARLVLLVIDTRVSHALTDGSYGNRRTESADAARALGVAASGTPARLASRSWRTTSSAAEPATSSARTSACSPPSGRSGTATGMRSPMFSTRRTRRCATTSRSPAASSTWPSRAPARPVRWVPG